MSVFLMSDVLLSVMLLNPARVHKGLSGLCIDCTPVHPSLDTRVALGLSEVLCCTSSEVTLIVGNFLFWFKNIPLIL